MSNRVLTQSELATFDRCRREWWVKYYRRLKRRYDTPYLPTVGTLVHAGLEAYYKGDAADPIDVVKDRALALIADNEPVADEIADAAGLAGIMLEGYMEWVAESGADVGLDVYAAEERVDVPLEPTPYVLRGKIDARAIREFDGARVQLEHKTVSSLNTLPETAQTNFQFLTYDLLAYLKSIEDADTTYRTDGVLLNMLRRVKRTARAKPPFYDRHIVRHNKQELRNHWRHVVAIARDIDAVTARLDAGEDPQVVCRPSPGNCCGTWRGKSMRAVCALFDDGSDAEGFLAAEYEEHDPLAHYEDGTEEDA